MIQLDLGEIIRKSRTNWIARAYTDQISFGVAECRANVAEMSRNVAEMSRMSRNVALDSGSDFSENKVNFEKVVDNFCGPKRSLEDWLFRFCAN